MYETTRQNGHSRKHSINSNKHTKVTTGLDRKRPGSALVEELRMVLRVINATIRIKKIHYFLFDRRRALVSTIIS